jgi:hypothetical protein
LDHFTYSTPITMIGDSDMLIHEIENMHMIDENVVVTYRGEKIIKKRMVTQRCSKQL